MGKIVPLLLRMGYVPQLRVRNRKGIMFLWLIRSKDGIQVFRHPDGAIDVHTPEIGTLMFKGKYEIEKCLKILGDKKRMKMIIWMLRAALEEKNGRRDTV